jgi:hypothetical protein
MDGLDRAAVLSAGGTARREAILDLAQGALRARRQRRVVLQLAACAAPVLAVALTLALTRWSMPAVPKNTDRGPVAGAIMLRSVDFQDIETMAGLADRAVAHRPVAAIQILTDDELLEALQAAGRPTGLIRTAAGVSMTARVAANEAEPAEHEHGDGATGKRTDG